MPGRVRRKRGSEGDTSGSMAGVGAIVLRGPARSGPTRRGPPATDADRPAARQTLVARDDLRSFTAGARVFPGWAAAARSRIVSGTLPPARNRASPEAVMRHRHSTLWRSAWAAVWMVIPGLAAAQTPPPTFLPAQSYPVNGQPTFFVVADFNGDG